MKESSLYEIVAVIFFFYGLYLLYAMKLFSLFVVNDYGIPHVGIVDNDWGGSLVSFGISCYAGLELCVMAHKADEKEHWFDEVFTGCPS